VYNVSRVMGPANIAELATVIRLLFVVFYMLRKFVCNNIYLVFGTVNRFVHAPQNALHYSVVGFVFFSEPSNKNC